MNWFLWMLSQQAHWMALWTRQEKPSAEKREQEGVRNESAPALRRTIGEE